MIQAPAVGTLNSMNGIPGYVASQAGTDINGWLTRQGIDPSSAGSITSTQLPSEAQGKITVSGNKVSLASDAAGVDVGYLVGDAQGNENLTVSVSNMTPASGHENDTFPVKQALARTWFNGTTAHGNVTYKYNALITIRFSFDATWTPNGMVITPSNSAYADLTQQLQDGFNTSDDFPALTLSGLNSAVSTLTKNDTSQVPYSFANYVNGALAPGGSTTVNLSNVVSGSWLDDFNMIGVSKSGALANMPVSSWFSSNVMASLSKLPGLTSVKNAQTAADFVAPIISAAAQNGSLNTWASNQAIASYQYVIDELESQSGGVIDVDPVTDATKNRIRSNTTAAMTSMVNSGLPAWIANGVSANVQMDATLNPGSVTSLTPTGVTYAPTTPQVDPQASSLSLSANSIVVDPQADCTGSAVVSPSSVTATATVMDTNGQPMADVPVTFGVDPQFTLDNPTVNTNSQGIATAVITLNSASGAQSKATSVTARVEEGSGVDLSPASLSVTAMEESVVAPTLTVEPAGDASVLANGQDSYTVSVAILDHCSRPVSGTDVQFTVTGSAQLSAGTQPSGSDGIASVTITDTKAEPVTVTARSGGVQIGDPATLVFAPAPLSTLFTVAPSAGTVTVKADGQSSWTAKLTVTQNGQPAQLPNWETQLALLPSSPSLTISDLTDNSGGIYTATVTSQTPGSFQVIAMYGTTNLGTQTVSFVASGPNPGKSSLTADIPVTAANCGQEVSVVARAVVRDDQGIVLPGVDVTFALGTETRVVKTDGTGTATLTVNYTMGSDDIQDPIHATIDVNGTAMDIGDSPTVVSVTSQGACYMSALVMTPDSSPVYADGTSTWTGVLAVTSATGESTAGQAGNITVNIYAGSDPTGRVTKGAITDNGDGTYTMKFTSTSPGDYSVRASFYQYAATPQTITFAALTPAGGTLAPATQTVVQPCDGSTAEGTVVATVVDAQGHAVSGAHVVFTVGNNSPQTVTTNPDGTATIKVSSDSQQPSYTVQVHASLEGSSTELAGSPVAIVYQLADGCGPAPAMSGTLTLQPTQDVNGQALAVAMVVDGQGAPALNAQVSLTISGNAQFSNGTNSITVPTTADGMAVAMVTPTSTDCSNQGFDVSGTILGGDQPIPLTGSPVHVSVQPPAGACWPTLTIATQPTSGSTVYANGADTWAIVFTVANWDGTPVLDGADSFHGITVMGADGQATDNVRLASEITNNGDGTYTLLATTTVPGTYSVTAMWGDASSTSQPVMTFQSVLQGAQLTSDITPNPLVADGSQARLRVSLTDASGDPISGESSALVISADPGLTIGEWTDNNNGTYDATVASRLPGTYSIAVSAVDEGGAVRASTTATVVFTMVRPSLTSSLLELDGSTVEYAQVSGDGCAGVSTQTPVTATATVKDGSGAPMAGIEVSFSSDDPAVVVSSTSQTTDANGVASVQVTVSETAAVVPSEVHISAEVAGTDGPADISGSPATVELVRTAIGDCCVPGEDCPLVPTQIPTPTPTQSTAAPTPTMSSPAPATSSPAPATSSPAPATTSASAAPTSMSASATPSTTVTSSALATSTAAPASSSPAPATSTSAPASSSPAPVTSSPVPTESASGGLNPRVVVYGAMVVEDGHPAGGDPIMVGFAALDVDMVTMDYVMVSGVRADFVVDSGSATLDSSSCVTDGTGVCVVHVSSDVAGSVVVRVFVDGQEVPEVPGFGFGSPVTVTFTAPSSSEPSVTTSAPAAPATSSPAPATTSASAAPTSTSASVSASSTVTSSAPATSSPAPTSSQTPTSAPTSPTSAPTSPTSAPATSAPATSAPATSSPAPTESTSAAPNTHVVVYGVVPVGDGQAAGGDPIMVGFGAYDVDPVTMDYTVVSGVRADFVVDSGSATLDSSSCVTDGTGVCVVHLSSDVAGSVVVRVFVNGQEIPNFSGMGYGSPVTVTFAPSANPTTAAPTTSSPAPTTSSPAPTTSSPAPTAPAPTTSSPAPTTSSPAPTAPAPTTSAPTTSSPAPTTSAPTTSSPAPTSSAPVPPVTHSVYYGVSVGLDGHPAGGVPNVVGFTAMDVDSLTLTATPVSGVRVDFTIDSGSGTLVQSWCQTDETGTCAVPVVSPAAGTVVVRAFVDGQEVTGVPGVGTYASPVTLTFANPAPLSSPQIAVDTSSFAAGTLIVSGAGWIPGESVHIVITSNIYDLGAVTANPDGTIPDVTFSVPADFEAGSHTITAVGSQSGSAMSTFVVPGSAPQGSVPQNGTSIRTGGTAAVMPDLAWLLIAVIGVSAGLFLVRRRNGRA